MRCVCVCVCTRGGEGRGGDHTGGHMQPGLKALVRCYTLNRAVINIRGKKLVLSGSVLMKKGVYR